MNRLLALVTACSLVGCSIATLDAPVVTPQNTVVCDSAKTKPLIDTAVSVVAIATPFILEATRDRSKDDPKIVLSVALWAVGLGSAISAVVGYKRTGRCADLKQSVANTSNVAPQAPAPQAPAPQAPASQAPAPAP